MEMELAAEQAAAEETEGAMLSHIYEGECDLPARDIDVITDEIIFYKAVGGQAIIEIGKRLIEAKAQLKHGEWLPWLREKVEFSESSAQRFMQLAREYGNPATVRDLGAAKALALLALPPLEREDFAAEKHLVNGEEKSVSEMSKRELEEAIRQKKNAEARADEMQREMDKLRTANEETARKADEAAEAEARARSEVEDAKNTALAAQERMAELEKELRVLREKPVDVAVQTVDASEAQIAAAVERAKKEAEALSAEKLGKKAEELKAAKEKLAEANKAVESAEEKRKAAAAEAETLREALDKAKKSAAAQENKALAEFAVLYRQTQESVNRMVELLGTLEGEERDKIKRALSALAEKIEESAGGE